MIHPLTLNHGKIQSYFEHLQCINNVLISKLWLQHSSDKIRLVDRVCGNKPGVDFMIVDMPEGLHVRTISTTRAPVPKWNNFKIDYLFPVFDFTQEFLHDTGALILIYLASSPLHRSHILGCCQSYKFHILETYVSSNHLHLISAANTKKTVHLVHLT